MAEMMRPSPWVEAVETAFFAVAMVVNGLVVAVVLVEALPPVERPHS